MTDQSPYGHGPAGDRRPQPRGAYGCPRYGRQPDPNPYPGRPGARTGYGYPQPGATGGYVPPGATGDPKAPSGYDGIILPAGDKNTAAQGRVLRG